MANESSGVVDAERPIGERAALIEVGRTVVNFQRLEYKLKQLARLGPSSGTLAALERAIQRRSERAERMSLGQAIAAWGWLDGRESSNVCPTPDLFEPTINHTIQLGENQEVRRAMTDALEVLLKDRNALIHSDLLQVDWRSSEDCAGLIARLGEINSRIGPVMEFFDALIAGVQELARVRAEDIEWEIAE